MILYHLCQCRHHYWFPYSKQFLSKCSFIIFLSVRVDYSHEMHVWQRDRYFNRWSFRENCKAMKWLNFDKCHQLKKSIKPYFLTSPSYRCYQQNVIFSLLELPILSNVHNSKDFAKEWCKGLFTPRGSVDTRVDARKKYIDFNYNIHTKQRCQH